VGRVLLDTVSESILSLTFFCIKFVAWFIQWSVATVFFLLVMAGAGYYVFMEALDGGRYVTVPKITDLPITEASLLLAEQGLELGSQTQVPHATIPKYHVIAQRPDAGRVVRTGRKVYPIVSMGLSFMKAPSLLKKSLDEAREELAQSRFRVGSVARIPHASPRDTIISQDPPPGRDIPNQGDIHLLVSAGTEKQSAFMPDIRGMNVQDALKLLMPYNVKLIPNKVDIPDAREDVVLNQDPVPDALIYPGQLVTYDVKPSGTVDIPDARYEAEIRYTVDYDWADRDVRVDLVDRRGARRTVWKKTPLYDALSKSRYVAGTVLRIPVTYVSEATVEICINGAIEASYRLKDGSDPERLGESEMVPPAAVQSNDSGGF
jgi:serine/threonine-protein kinase